MKSCLHGYHSHVVGVTLGGLLSTLTWPGEHEKGLLTSPPFGWRAGASDWIASSSCIFCVNTYSGKKYLSALFLSMWRSVLHRGATQNPVPHIFLPSSQAADAENGSHDHIFSNDFFFFFYVYIWPLCLRRDAGPIHRGHPQAESDGSDKKRLRSSMQCGKCSESEKKSAVLPVPFGHED